jgi:hypothetical protein
MRGGYHGSRDVLHCSKERAATHLLVRPVDALKGARQTMNSTHERPILFSAPMVRAILAGEKTMTRRPTKEALWNSRADSHLESVRPGWEVRGGPASTHNDWVATFIGGGTMPGGRWLRHAIACPFGAPGDRLWVRETMRLRDAGKRSEAWTYAADGAEVSLPKGDPRIGAMLAWAHHKEGNACVSIHMPRWASRIDLEVTAVRVERLQSITEEDALAEGLRPLREQGLRTIGQPGWQWGDGQGEGTRDAFSVLWDDINGTKAPWAANPWVWVVSFRRVRPA